MEKENSRTNLAVLGSTDYGTHAVLAGIATCNGSRIRRDQGNVFSLTLVKLGPRLQDLPPLRCQLGCSPINQFMAASISQNTRMLTPAFRAVVSKNFQNSASSL